MFAEPHTHSADRRQGNLAATTGRGRVCVIVCLLVEVVSTIGVVGAWLIATATQIHHADTQSLAGAVIALTIVAVGVRSGLRLRGQRGTHVDGTHTSHPGPLPEPHAESPPTTEPPTTPATPRTDRADAQTSRILAMYGLPTRTDAITGLTGCLVLATVWQCLILQSLYAFAGHLWLILCLHVVNAVVALPVDGCWNRWCANGCSVWPPATPNDGCTPIKPHQEKVGGEACIA